MNRKEIIKNFRKLHGVEAKENFMRANKIKFTYDSFYNLIVFADDGIIERRPERKCNG